MYDMSRIEKNSIPEPNTGCWLWLRSIDDWGYARTQYPLPSGRSEGLAHRAAYILTHPAEMMDGMHVHHKCKQPSCVNPEHLELVTPAEHLLLDDPGYKRRRRRPKTHCPSGHELSGDNLVLITLQKTGRVMRMCRACRKAAMHKYYRNNKGANHG